MNQLQGIPFILVSVLLVVSVMTLAGLLAMTWESILEWWR